MDVTVPIILRVLWTTSSMDNQVYLYDSLPRKRVSDNLQSQVRAVYGQSTHAVVVPYVHKQKNRVDCGCFSITWALHLALGEKPEEILLDTKCSLFSHYDNFDGEEIDTFPAHNEEESPHSLHHHTSN